MLCNKTEDSGGTLMSGKNFVWRDFWRKLPYWVFIPGGLAFAGAVVLIWADPLGPDLVDQYLCDQSVLLDCYGNLGRPANRIVALDENFV